MLTLELQLGIGVVTDQFVVCCELHCGLKPKSILKEKFTQKMTIRSLAAHLQADGSRGEVLYFHKTFLKPHREDGDHKK